MGGEEFSGWGSPRRNPSQSSLNQLPACTGPSDCLTLALQTQNEPKGFENSLLKFCRACNGKAVAEITGQQINLPFSNIAAFTASTAMHGGKPRMRG